jgi:hypothetical protein
MLLLLLLLLLNGAVFPRDVYGFDMMLHSIKLM